MARKSGKTGRTKLTRTGKASYNFAAQVLDDIVDFGNDAFKFDGKRWNKQDVNDEYEIDMSDDINVDETDTFASAKAVKNVKDYFDNELTTLIGGAPGTLDTLNELAAALGDDANHVTTMTNLIDIKVDTRLPLAGGSLTGNLNLNDNSQIWLGDTGDLRIFHAGTNSYIQDVGTGDLIIEANNLRLRTYGGENYLTGTQNGQVNLYHNGISKFNTSLVGVQVAGDIGVTGTVTHSGLVPTDGTAIDQIKTYIKSLNLATSSWYDSGINSDELATGSYMVQVTVDNHAVGGGHWDEIYTGMMSWTSSDTNSDVTDEIVLHRAGHSPNNSIITLRTERTWTADTNNMMLQIATTDPTNNPTNYTFKFRRMM